MKLRDIGRWMLPGAGFKSIGRRWRWIADRLRPGRLKSARTNQPFDPATLRLSADERRLLDMARSAAHPATRLEAALRIGDPSALTAIALNEWEIRRGLAAIGAIHNDLLLRRIARSARQDAIRVEAALKLGHRRVLKETALSINDVRLRWEIARRIKDPLLMAEIAHFKPSNERFDAMRAQAHGHLTRHFDRLRVEENFAALEEAIRTIPYARYKIEAFLRLPLDGIRATLIQSLARQELQHIPDRLLHGFFDHIHAAGWRIDRSKEVRSCYHCRGKGHLTVKCAAEDPAEMCQSDLPCPECNGTGEIAYRTVTLSRELDPPIVFRFAVGDE